MIKFLKILSKILVSLLIIAVIFAAGIWIFMETAPQFGAVIEGAALAKIKESPHYQNGEFKNLIPTTLNTMTGKDYASLMYDFLFNASQGSPTSSIPTAFGEGSKEYIDTAAYITWYGHSAILLEIEGKKILLDPMLGPASAPVSFATKRFPYQEPIDISELKNIDAVIFSHDHYDHLDYPTVIQIKDQVGHFFTPLGLGEHLKKWGVPKEKITELDWWESVTFKNIELAATPSRHFSGRGISDQNKTQWASWVILGEFNKIYFSGDGGYANHFQQIGEKYGPFDFAMMECGQYNTLWAKIHMVPEETIQASIDIKASQMMPIHWGAFKLAPHDWKDPIERAITAARVQNVNITTPKIGRRFDIRNPLGENWWEEVD